MLKDGTVLMAICIIGLGGVLAWWIKAPLHPTHWVSTQVEAPAATPATKAVSTATIVKSSPKFKAATPAVEEAPASLAIDAPVAPLAEPATPASAAVQTPARPFPAVEQISSGSHGETITDKFGDPALSAVTSNGGHIVETFVYSKNRGRNATVIRLQDGKVATAYSQVAPVAPSGLSAPRRFQGQ